MPVLTLSAWVLWIFSATYVSRLVFFREDEERLAQGRPTEDRAEHVLLSLLVLAIPTMVATNVIWANINGPHVTDSPKDFYKPAYFLLIPLVGLALTWSIPFLHRWWTTPLLRRTRPAPPTESKPSARLLLSAINLIASILTIIGFVLARIGR